MKSNFIKSIGLFFIALLIVIIISSFKNSSNRILHTFLWDELYLSGKLKSVNVSCFNVNSINDTIEKSEMKWSNLYIFNKKGDVSKVFNSDGSLENTFKYKYNKNNNITVQISYFGKRNFDSKSIFEYDEKGNITEEKMYFEDGTLYSKYIMVYDIKDKLTEEYYYEDDTLSNKRNYKYYNEGKTIEKTIFHSNIIFKSFDLIHINEYDNNGILLEENRYDFEGNLKIKFTYKYQLDSIGNWIVQIKYINGKAVSLIEREIEYFD